MTIEVVNQDGSIIEFPDNTDERTITTVMRQYDQEQAARTQARSPQPQARPQQQLGATGPDGDTWTGTILDPMLWDSVRRGAGGVAEMARQVPSLDLPQLGRDIQQTASDDWRQFSADPIGNTGRFIGGIPGAVARPFNDLLTAVPEQRRALARGDRAGAQAAVDRGASAAPEVALMAAPTLGGGVRAATTIAAGSALPLSLAHGEGSLQQRLPRAVVSSAEAAGITAPLAAGIGAIPARGARTPTPGPSPVLPSGTSERVMEDALRTARRNRNIPVRSFDELSTHLQSQAEQHPNRTVAEALGEPGVARGMALTRMPGQTAQLAEDTLAPRMEGQLQRVENEVLQGSQTGDALEQSVRDAWKTRGAELYRPLMSEPMNGAQNMALERLRASGLWSHRAVQSAWERAGQMVQDDIALGRLGADAAQSIKTRLHYAKVALSNMVDDPRTLEPGLANIDNANLTATAHQFADALESIMPGYRAARSELADLGAARRAIEAGRQFSNVQRFRSDEALARHVRGLSPGEQPYFAAGVEDALRQTITRAGRDGRRNVAGALQGENTLRRLEAVFGPERARRVRDFLRNESQDFVRGNRLRAAHNSPTAQMQQEMADLGASVPTSKRAIIDRYVVGPAEDATINRWRESYRDALGRYYMTPLSQASDAGGSVAANAAREAEAARVARLTSRKRRRGLFGNAFLPQAIGRESAEIGR